MSKRTLQRRLAQETETLQSVLSSTREALARHYLKQSQLSLLEALDSAEVTSVLSIGRRRVDVEHPKLRQLVHDDLENFESLAEELGGLDACLWCLGTASAGLDEEAYRRITHDFTIAAAKVVCERSPDLRFCFVSGAGADDTENGRTMWARVKGKTENALRRFGFRELLVFRPAFIRPMRGSVPRGALYRVLYALLRVLDPLLRVLGMATSTVEIGRAMIAAGRGEAGAWVLDTRAINRLAERR